MGVENSQPRPTTLMTTRLASSPAMQLNTGGGRRRLSLASNNRSSVKREFKYYLPEVFKAKDPKMYALITDTTKGYRLPTRPPNGKYTGKKTCASGANVI